MDYLDLKCVTLKSFVLSVSIGLNGNQTKFTILLIRFKGLLIGLYL